MSPLALDVATAVARTQAPAADDDTADQARLLGLSLDQIDYALLLMSTAGEVCHANRAALRAWPGLADPLRWARCVDARLRAALAAGSRGRRSFVEVSTGHGTATAAIIPLPGAQHLLLLLGRSLPCMPLALDFFAKLHGLTPAETGVMRELCNGLCPAEIARASGTALSTVRTHIVSLRQKTGAAGIVELIRMLCLLPPMPSLLG